MNPFCISVTHCDLEKTAETVSKHSIESAIRTVKNESKARRRIAASILHARIKRDQAYQRAEQILEEANQKAEQLENTWKEDAQRQAINESLTWYVEQADLERSLIDNMKDRIRQQVRNVIEKWSTEQDISQFMIKRLSDQIALQSCQQSLILFVSHEHYSAMQQTFGEYLTVKIKTELNHSQAQLVSEHLIVRLDLEQHLQTLLDSFSHSNSLQSTVCGE
ncbi:type III secretion protein [Vibrio pectenicida]|uniref:Type III secretion protein n=1 Tax=Vibrio pectenicida TaxID=62763 RepID=A0A427U2Q0_9VIBR|nr:type III secretion protein [Vibrio pectenicida]NOH71589.1 type III secretion protein [Vibrio pectenicida]RSD30950.1 type III secretion protein [Vibrio pectenicida]